MFDVSLTELMVIGVVALIVIGPERLPKVARTVGHLLGRAQRYVNDVKSDIQREIELDELRKFKTEMEDAAQGVQQSLNETGASLQEPVQQFRAELDEVAREASGKATPAVAQAPVTAQVADAAQAPAAGSPAAGSPAADASVAGASAEPARTIAPPSQNHNLDLDLPAAEPAPRPAAAPQPPAPAPSAPAADVAAPAAKPVSPSGTPS
ncbi:Sec-independent protein translocase protein TatB [Achromobacter animicus]|uniref:Sec-independent protein translocase protein TatB n=1 Tax=Achromobacter animicus TaxID=1389935 RepID=UPI00345E6ACC